MTQSMPKTLHDHTVLCIQTWMLHSDAQAFLEAFKIKYCQLPGEVLDKIREYKPNALVFYVLVLGDYHTVMRVRYLYPDMPILIMKPPATEKYMQELHVSYVDVAADTSIKDIPALLEDGMRSAYRLVGIGC